MRKKAEKMMTHEEIVKMCDTIPGAMYPPWPNAMPSPTQTPNAVNMNDDDSDYATFASDFK